VKVFPKGALYLSHDETSIISPVAMCAAQVLYRGTRDRVEEEEPNQHDPGMHELQASERLCPHGQLSPAHGQRLTVKEIHPSGHWIISGYMHCGNEPQNLPPV
jgi:hypothetical protein